MRGQKRARGLHFRDLICAPEELAAIIAEIEESLRNHLKISADNDASRDSEHDPETVSLLDSLREKAELLSKASSRGCRRIGFLESAINNVGQGLCAFDGERRLVFWNDAFALMYDFPDDFLQIGTPLTKLFDFLIERGDFGRRAPEKQAERVSRLMEKRRGAIEVRRLNGTALKIFADQMSEGGVVVVLTDISDIIATREELREARDAAVAANRTKTEFLAAMGDEFRTPLSGVIGMTDLLMDTPLTAEQKQFAGTIRESAETLHHVLGNVLDASRIESGKFALNGSDFAPVEMLNGLINSALSRAQSKGLALLARIAPNVPIVAYGDEGRLRQVIINLINNAIGATSRGEITVSVAFDPDGEGGGIARFEVLDSGPGLPPEQAEGIFALYKGNRGGSGSAGIGLAISRQLIELMGGTIGVEPGEKGGCRFWFSVPLAAPRGGDILHPATSHSLARDSLLSETPLTDPEVIRELERALNRELVESLFQAYRTDARQRLAAIRSAAEADNAKTLEEEAHSIQGASGNLGLRRISSCARQIVVACRQDRSADAIALIPVLEKIAENTLGALASLGLAIEE
ncbi:MAG: PAS-domain containing protein [Rhodospirillales bacterium]|nr:PAS-domain containing protein [Rhodospirillales bacterium]MCW8953281.1 PAS-domain containing protein [Rhodospirillales bacterium]MCW8970341.1 PAS-domain containing protein [Rhodospirillales bacterium]MCW9001641.1 PAS-domain containing protein [Rhodospirillales bacterium]